MIFRLNIHQGFSIGFILMVCITGVSGQESREDGEPLDGEKVGTRHQVAAGAGLTFIHVTEWFWETEAGGLLAPSLGADYYMHLHPKWRIGLMANYELDHYKIVDAQIERGRALLMSLVGMYQITRYWGVFAGGGIETESADTRALLRIGVEYAIEIKKNRVILPRFWFDFKESYDAWSIDIAFGKRF